MVWFLLGKCLAARPLHHRVIRCSTSSETCHAVPKQRGHFTLPPAMFASSTPSFPLSTLSIVSLPSFANTAGGYWYFIVILVCVFLMTSRCKHSFLCLLVSWISSFVKCLLIFYRLFLVCFIIFFFDE